MKLNDFNKLAFLPAVKGFFKSLDVPMNYVTDEPTTAQDILKDTYKDNTTFALIDDVYFVGMVDDAAFEGNQSLSAEKIKSDYDGVLIFGITLHRRENNLLPTRSQLAEISRAFNREFYYTPVVLVFQYQGEEEKLLAFANTERLQYKQAWREGEKAGKVSLLRDISVNNPHRGHIDILSQLKIPTTGRNQVDSFAKIYSYWQSVFSVSLLNKKFYQELSNWYFWAIKHVTFPSGPTAESVFAETGKNDDAKLKEAIQEHNAKNVIRLLTRLLFVWFIKEKKLIPEDLFDLNALQGEILEDISPLHEEGLFQQQNLESIYYKTILQNLFFASLNCPINADGLDTRTRGFRGDESYGKHRGIDHLMRYKKHFKDPDKFLEMMNQTVPFLNGGLFECLDDKENNIYIDGFSDNMTKGNALIVPDFLFFGIEEKADLSKQYGVKNKATKEAAVKGLINILKDYKFTITENTPVEEDVALDPELLGKVFENLLASYNPETKTTARKQTGSFYTPREIVSYMVDESLIAYIKNKISYEDDDQQLDKELHHLFSFDNTNPFDDKPELQKQIIDALDSCKILDPACGSGAFPMGVLQKMVHVLHKVDPKSTEWKQRQIDKVNKQIELAEEIEDSQFSERSIYDLELQKQDIEDAFENNELDYGRKLFLIENCVYGVDIQPIATQISKLRFFISLVVDQKIDVNKTNFGIRPLPNLETKFVAANTLIGIEKPSDQLNLYDTTTVKDLEKELKLVRHKLFNAKTKATKIKYRQKDEELRHQIAEELIKSGWSNDTADKLASWDPYDQNASSPFFDPEWMFDAKGGFDVVIGNPPYRPIQKYCKEQKNEWANQKYKVYANSGNIYFLFYERSLNISKESGVVTFITSNQWMRNKAGQPLRKLLIASCPELLIDFKGTDIFDNVAVLSNILLVTNKQNENNTVACDVSRIGNSYKGLYEIVKHYGVKLDALSEESWLIFDQQKLALRNQVIQKGTPVGDWNLDIYRGILTGLNDAFYLTPAERNKLVAQDPKNSEIIKPMLRGKDLDRFYPRSIEYYLIFSRRGINIDRYPVIKEHLNHFYLDLKPKKKASDERGRKPGDYQWFEIQDSINYYKKFEEPKMIFMNMSKDLVFSLDLEGEFLTNQKCFIVTGKHIKYLTAFFNTKFFQYFFKDNFPELLGDVREVSKVYFEKIPVFLPEEKTLRLIEGLVDILVYSKSEGMQLGSQIISVLEGLISELYFSSHMKDKRINIIQYVLNDVLGVLGNQDFSDLSSALKTDVVKQLYKKWTHPDNEVRNRIKLFAVRSPDILKPIIEG